jgi:hypothetical protein
VEEHEVSLIILKTAKMKENMHMLLHLLFVSLKRVIGNMFRAENFLQFTLEARVMTHVDFKGCVIDLRC